MELVRNAPIERLNFDGGAWVDLRAQLTFAERKRLAGAAVAVDQTRSADGKVVFTPRADPAGVELAALQIGIVAWSLPDPVTPENVALLDDVTGDAIKQRLDELWRGRTDESRGNSSGGGAPPSEPPAPSPLSSPGSP